MIALYRVPEPDPPGNQAALDPEVSQQLWKITLHNFSPDDLDFEKDFELVVLTHRPQFDPEVSPSTALPNFIHPQHAVYLIGPDSRKLESGDIPLMLEKLRRHNVHIPTGSLHPMWGHVVWSIVYWDRLTKAGLNF